MVALASGLAFLVGIGASSIGAVSVLTLSTTCERIEGSACVMLGVACIVASAV